MKWINPFFFVGFIAVCIIEVVLFIQDSFDKGAKAAEIKFNGTEVKESYQDDSFTYKYENGGWVRKSRGINPLSL